MEYGGASERVSLWLVPPSCHMSFDRDSSLTGLGLCHSLCYRPGYDNFRSRLKQSLPLPDGPTLPTTGDMMIDAALEVLWTEREREEDHDGTGSGVRGSVTDHDEDMVDETDQPHAPVDEVDNALEISVDNALGILVHNATEEFGFAPRDVYNGVLDLPTMRLQHTALARNFSYSKLKSTVEMFSMEHELDDSSSHVVVVYPLPCTMMNLDEWGMDFKSIRIAREVMEQMQLEDYRHLLEAFNFLYKDPDYSSLAGWYFEAIADRILSSGWRSDGPAPQPIPMVSDRLVPPTFSTDPDSSPSRLPFAPLRAGTRVTTPVDFAHKNKLRNLTLDGKNYYKPTNANNPFFDSFTIDHDCKAHTIMISIFQITISPKCGGSPKGYLHIRKIMGRVHELLKEAGKQATVKVTYFLVCPESESQHQWQMPDGWKRTGGHHGKVFCVRIPVSACRGMLRLSVPNCTT